METALSTQAKHSKNTRFRMLSGGFSQRLSRFLSPEAFTLYRRRGANLRRACIRTVVFSPIYYPSGNVYRHREYIFLNLETGWLEYKLLAGQMAYSRKISARFSANCSQRRKKLSRFHRPTTTYAGMERLEICRAKGKECPHKPRLMATSSGHFAFYCEYCGIAWRTICTHRRIHSTNKERASAYQSDRAMGINS